MGRPAAKDSAVPQRVPVVQKPQPQIWRPRRRCQARPFILLAGHLALGTSWAKAHKPRTLGRNSLRQENSAEGRALVSKELEMSMRAPLSALRSETLDWGRVAAVGGGGIGGRSSPWLRHVKS